MGGEESKEGDKHKGGQDLRREDILRPVDGAELQTGIDVDQGPGQHTEGSGPEEGFQGDTDHARQIVDDEDGKNRQDPESHQIADAVALLIFVTAILAPAVEVAVMLYLLLPLRFGRVPTGFATILPVVQKVKRWNMVEVFMLGLLVSLVKLSKIASVVPDLALWSFGGLTLLMTAVAASFDPREIWARAETAGGKEKSL
jgi:hypothetical protein